MPSTIKHVWVFATVLFVLAITFVTPASAGTIGLNGSTLIFTSSDAGDSVLVALTSATEVTLSGETFDILTPSCSGSITSVHCTLADFNVLAIIEISGDDVVDATGVGSILDLFISGGEGEDILLGGAGDDILKGGPGDDVLFGGPGDNLLFGGSGGDILIDGIEGDDAQAPPDPTLAPTAVPEPATLLLTGMGLAAPVFRRAKSLSRRKSPSSV